MFSDASPSIEKTSKRSDSSLESIGKIGRFSIEGERIIEEEVCGGGFVGLLFL